MTLSTAAPPAAAISYPPVARGNANLAFNIAQQTTDEIDLVIAAGATAVRWQPGWSDVGDFNTGALTLSAQQIAMVTYCAAHGIKQLWVAAYSPPHITIGTLTVTGIVPAGSPQGTPIPVASYAFGPIAANSTDLAGGLFEGYPGGLTGRTSYWGDMIQFADQGSIQLAAALTQQLNPGDTLKIQRLRWAPPRADGDSSVLAYCNEYVLALASLMHSLGATGWIEIWNEYVWAHDRWSEIGQYYDNAAGFGFTLSPRMKSILQTCQTLALPAGVKLVNGVSDKDGGNAIASSRIQAPGTNFYADAIHPYGNDPEQSTISFFGYGASIGKYTPPPVTYHASTDGSGDNGWDAVIPNDESGTFRGLLFHQQFEPGGPWPGAVVVSESGFQTANDLTQARWVARSLLANWGSTYAWYFVFNLDGSNAAGANVYDVYSSTGPRQAYTALQSIMAVIGRMDAAGAISAVPAPVDLASTAANPLMCTTIAGDQPGNYVLFCWQRTWNNTSSGWPAIDSPTPRAASIFLPPHLRVAESFDVITGAAVTPTTVNATLITVPVADDPVAIRFAPA